MGQTVANGRSFSVVSVSAPQLRQHVNVATYKERGAKNRKLLFGLVGLVAILTLAFSGTLVSFTDLGLRAALSQSALGNITYILASDETANLAGLPPVTACRYCYTCYIDSRHKQQSAEASTSRRTMLARQAWQQQQQQQLALVPPQQPGPGFDGSLAGLDALPPQVADASLEELWYIHLREQPHLHQPADCAHELETGTAAARPAGIPAPPVLLQLVSPGRRLLQQEEEQPAAAKAAVRAAEEGSGDATTRAAADSTVAVGAGADVAAAAAADGVAVGVAAGAEIQHGSADAASAAQAAHADPEALPTVKETAAAATTVEEAAATSTHGSKQRAAAAGEGGGQEQQPAAAAQQQQQEEQEQQPEDSVREQGQQEDPPQRQQEQGQAQQQQQQQVVVWKLEKFLEPTSRMQREAEAAAAADQAAQEAAKQRQQEREALLEAIQHQANLSDAQLQAIQELLQRKGAPSHAAKQELLKDPRAAYPNCTHCTACTHELQPLAAERELLGVKYKLGGQGASRAWIFKASSQYGEEGVAAAKVWCIPIDKQGQVSQSCELGSMDKYVSKLKALDKLIDDCDLRHLFSRVWVERVRGLLPVFGYVVDSEGMFMDIARGVSLNQQTFYTPPSLLQKNIWQLWQTINRSHIVEAAIFDLLTSQCDRHADNVFVDEGGRLTLIDNDQMLGESWRKCGVDSLFLPTTQKFEINVHGYHWVMRAKWRNARPKGYPNPQLFFDYRCHVPGGRLGTSYPPGLQRCIEKLDGMSARGVADQYGFHPQQATILQQRASDMLRQGFEWTLENGYPRNPSTIAYGWQPPCCNMTYVGYWSGVKDDWRCLDKWEPEVQGEGRQPWLTPPRNREEANMQAAELRIQKKIAQGMLGFG